MKDYLVTIGAILLGIFIVGVLILGDGPNSVKSQGTNVQTKMVTEMNTINTW